MCSGMCGVLGTHGLRSLALPPARMSPGWGVAAWGTTVFGDTRPARCRASARGCPRWGVAARACFLPLGDGHYGFAEDFPAGGDAEAGLAAGGEAAVVALLCDMFLLDFLLALGTWVLAVDRHLAFGICDIVIIRL